MDEQLWIPEAAKDKETREFDKQLHLYDDRLVLTRHFHTNDWVVCVTLEGGNLYPIFGLGQTLPDPLSFREQLYRADTRRRGTAILDEINKHNEEIQKRYRDKADDAAGQAAEALEWGFRRQTGDTSKIFVPRGI